MTVQDSLDDAVNIGEELDTETELDAELVSDELRETLESYLRLPNAIDLRITADEVILLTTDFPALIKESTGFCFHKYFNDVWSSVAALSKEESERLCTEFVGLFKTVKAFTSKEVGAVIVRTGETVVELPRALTSGVLASIVVGQELTFRIVAQAPDQVTFTNVSGLSLRCHGQHIALRELKLFAHDGICETVPSLEVLKPEKFERIVDSLKYWLLKSVLKYKKIKLNLPVIMEEFRQYLKDAIVLKTALREHKQDILTMVDNLGGMKLAEPLIRSAFRFATRYRRVGDKIEIVRDRVTLVDFGGVTLSLAPVLHLNVRQQTDKLKIENVEGVGVRIPFDPPKELKSLGLNLAKTLPSAINSFCLGLLNRSMRRQVIIGIGVNRWISVLIDEKMEPVFDNYGHCTVSGVATNPISGNGQSFYVRLNRNFEVDMSGAELMDLVTDTALEGFDPLNPSTWHWGVVAAGGGTLLTVGSMLKIDERTASAIKTGADTVKKGTGMLVDSVKKNAGPAAETIKQGAGQAAETMKQGAGQAADTVTKGASQAADTVTKGASQAADTVKKGAGKAADSVKKSAGSAVDFIKKKLK